MSNLYDVLNRLNITYEEKEHAPVTTVEEAKQIQDMIQGVGSKSLFLKDKRNNYYLVILEENKHANLKAIVRNAQTTRLSFASAEELQTILQLQPGSVTPFGILYDEACKVTLIVDADLQGKRLLFHPNVNTKTMAISFDDLIRVIEYLHHSYILLTM